MTDVKTHIKKNNDGTLSIGTSQDVEELLTQNQFEANNNVNRINRDTYGRKVASIPLNMLNMWCKEWGCTMFQLNADPTMKAKLFARLRDKEYLKLRTDTGRI